MFSEKRTIYFLLLSIVLIYSCRVGISDDDSLKLGKTHAIEELKKALNDKEEPNYLDHKQILIKDSLTAIKIAEPILFGIYGENNISAQRPYEVYLIGNYWVLNGTLAKDKLGGTFLIIINSMDSKVLKIIHGK
ncbi:YbbC/YhhH family protein [Pedobacter gandavensis]|uniref:YbbC/YhhH family protein n=1 Tax=Pedobacter gandavensis TaxID=2679963 RepID=UPI0029301DF3|nr:YbbC/YhhH family protein [Pedobacter gandavensis]